MTEAEQRARARCREHEGCKLEGYTDSLGKWTVGYGHLITDTDEWLKRRPNHAISQAEADQLFEEDWRIAAEGAQRLCEHHGVQPHDDEPRFWVLVEMTFQLGQAGLRRFSNMWNSAGQGAWAETALHALDSRWMEQTPRRARRLAMILWRGTD